LLNHSKHPVNLAFRFILELTTLATVAIWGFFAYDGLYAYGIGLGAPILMATVWGVFAVPNDPSRSGKTVIKTPGILRMLLEVLFFLIGSYTLYSLNYLFLFYGFSISVFLHYLLSLDRIKWLLYR
jgi:uncharacterized protein DUF2568